MTTTPWHAGAWTNAAINKHYVRPDVLGRDPGPEFPAMTSSATTTTSETSSGSLDSMTTRAAGMNRWSARLHDGAEGTVTPRPWRDKSSLASTTSESMAMPSETDERIVVNGRSPSFTTAQLETWNHTQQGTQTCYGESNHAVKDNRERNLRAKRLHQTHDEEAATTKASSGSTLPKSPQGLLGTRRYIEQGFIRRESDDIAKPVPKQG